MPDTLARTVTHRGVLYVLTPVAASHVRRGDLIFGENSTGAVFSRRVIDVFASLDPGFHYIVTDLPVRLESEFPLPRDRRNSQFHVSNDFLVPVFMGSGHADANR